MKKAPVCAIVVSAVLGGIAMLAIAIMVWALDFNPAPTLSPAAHRRARTPARIDVVYTWVDSADADWRAQRDSMTKRRIRAQLHTQAHRWPTLDGNLSELGISVKALRAFMPWVHTVWVVTQRPQRIQDPTLRFVHHDELLDAANLPTFNSNAIETGLHNIPGLAEHFIYMNDDVFVGEPLAPHDVFADGKPIMRLDNPIHNAFKQYRLFNNNRGGGPSIPRMRQMMHGRVYGTNHQIQPLTRTLMRDTQAAYPDAWAQTQASPFRDTRNVAPVTMSYNHGLRHGAVHILKKDRLSAMQAYVRDFRKLRARKPSLFCLHDITTVEQLRTLDAFVDQLIQERAPRSSVRSTN